MNQSHPQSDELTERAQGDGVRTLAALTLALTDEVRDHRVAEYPVHPQFLNRWSPRSFLAAPVADDVLLRLFEAARWAPSASNIQPWRYIVARTDADKETFYSFINEGNLAWCRRAPVLALLAAEKTAPNGNPNGNHMFDAGASWAYLALEAHRNGLITHPMAGFNKEAAKTALNLPDTLAPLLVIAIGYRGPANQLDESQQAREKPSPRRPLHEQLFEGGYAQPVRGLKT